MGHRKQLEEKLSYYANKQVVLRLNRNSESMITILDEQETYFRVSIHRRFLKACDRILKAVASFLNGGNLSYSLQTYIHSNEGIEPSVNRCTHEGSTYDLKKIYEEIKNQYFESSPHLDITWYGRVQLKRARRSRTLGLFDASKRLVKIHRLLDSKHVPDFYIKFVVYHEILHYLYPPKVSKSGRVLYHHKKFREVEKKFLEYEQAIRWEKEQSFWFEEVILES